MKKTIFSLFTLVFLVFFAPAGLKAQSGYEIRVEIKGLENKDLLFGYYFGSGNQTPVLDTLVLNSKAQGVLKGKEKLPGGMYFLYTHGHIYELLLDKDQHFKIQSDTTDFVANMKVSGSAENELLYEYKKYLGKQQAKGQELREKLKTAAGAEKKQISGELKEIGQKVQKKMDEIIEKNPDNFFAVFLKANKEVRVPKDLPQEEQYNHYKSHYFENFDFTDVRLFRTPIYEQKISNYLENVVVPVPDSIIKEADYLIQGVMPPNTPTRQQWGAKSYDMKNETPQQQLFRSMLITVHNHYASSQLMGIDSAFVYIADNYYKKYAIWSTQSYIDKLSEMIAKKRKAMLGKQAPDITVLALPREKKKIENLKTALDQIKQKGMPIFDAYMEKEKKQEAQIKQTEKDRGKIKELLEKQMANERQQTAQSLVPYIQEFNSEIIEQGGGMLSLHAVKRPYTLIWFWDPECSHCRKATPQLVETFNKTKKYGFQVIGIFLGHLNHNWTDYTGNITKWLNFIDKHGLDVWVNAYDAFHTSKFRDKYNINSSPVGVLVDSEKKIIAKRLSTAVFEDIVFEHIFEDIKEGFSGQERINRFKTLVHDPQFTLREMDAIEQGINRAYRKESASPEKKQVLDWVEAQRKVIGKQLEKPIKDLKAQYSGAELIQKIKDHADNIWNKADLEHIKNYIDKNLEGQQREKTLKHISSRMKYHLEE